MSVHDWTRVEAGIFHDLHVAWIPEIRTALNGGLLPDGFYALAEQHAGETIADVLTLHASTVGRDPRESWPPLPNSGGIAVAEAPPRTRRKLTLPTEPLLRRRSVAIRHVSGHRLVALIEILSPANKDRHRHVAEFADKIAGALEAGVHVLLVDLFPPGPHDPEGMHGAILRELNSLAEPYDLPPTEPLTLASYVAEPPFEIYLEHLAVGSPLPEMPLFLTSERYVNVPLETTYQAAYRGMPAFWREVLERPTLV